ETLAEAYQGLGQICTLVFIRLFENFSIITSFLGVSLALFSFNRDLYGLDIWKKLMTLVISLLPPLSFALFFVNSFIA
ncbi:aromatic amino acid transport family protein, partial [Francisella tularensis]|uniref:aromatic amino acid transport family protein n=1 Tax=Francisella tularensis TaxID=263 RepID=UPI002381CE68